MSTTNCSTMAARATEMKDYLKASGHFQEALAVLKPLQSAGKLHAQFSQMPADMEKLIAECQTLAK